MAVRSRAAIFATLVVACLVVAAIAIAIGRREQGASVRTSAAALTVLAEAKAEGRAVVVFRSMDPKGQVAVTTIADPSAEPTFEPLSCDRVDFAAGEGLCVARGKGLTAGYSAKLFGPDFSVRRDLGLEGIPSRARVSVDGRYGSVTMFVAGHSYAVAGSFSTATTLIDMARGVTIANLEDFTVSRAGRQVTAVDANYWGVTFDPRNSDHFYATLATGGKTYLVEGSVSGHIAHVIHENVECPSLSPDGQRIAYKRRTGSKEAPWRLTVLDLSTMRETPLGETQSIDDQAEWLDDSHVLYGRDGDIWAVPADGSGRPTRFITAADSPAVVRW